MNIKQLIISLALGDGYLTKPKSENAGSGLTIKHSSTQVDYLIYKQKILEQNGVKCKLHTYTDKNGYNVVHMTTTINKEIRKIRDILYLNNTKELTNNIMDSFNAFSLAILFQDDGSKELAKWHRSKGEKYAVKPYINAFVIHTCNFSYSSNLLLVDKMMEMGIDARISKRKGYFCIIISKKQAKQRFVDVIKPFMCNSMLYKIDKPVSFYGKL